ncbi:MAG: aminotransferase class V-fold PLP-dependent enzyme [Clostridia bacterium]|nr:aminotransferase class V-fold PLP-dependent enzyme [Clostridia bacterium]
MSELALFGGPKAITCDLSNDNPLVKWPIFTEEDEAAVLDVLRKNTMSSTAITKEFEQEFAKWLGAEYALGFNNGTSSILAALYGAGVRKGDEVICQSNVYWAAGTQVMSLGATPVYANIEEGSLCLDPDDIEAKISDKTKAILVVHYLAHPADMDRIMAVAKKHNVKVVEDVSHAQGGLYKGRRLGTIGDVGAMSLMGGKSFAVGEAGMLVTNDRSIYEHAVALGHYDRFTDADITCEDLKPFTGLPLGGYKFRMHQMSSAVGLVQIKYHDEQCAEIRKAMNYFWDLLEGVPGIRAHRVDESEGSNMAGWYAPHGIYVPEELEGLSVTRFCEAVRAEGFAGCWPSANAALHTHRLFQTADVYGDGKPTRIANADRDVRELDKSLGKSQDIINRCYSIPWLKKFIPEEIEQCANAFKKAALNYKELLKDDPGDPENLGVWFFYQHTAPKK